MQTGMVNMEVLPSRHDSDISDFTKQYNRQKTIIQGTEAGVPAAQLPKRNPQIQPPASVAPAAYTSRKGGAAYDDSLESLARYAGRIKLKDDAKYTHPLNWLTKGRVNRSREPSDVRTSS